MTLREIAVLACVACGAFIAGFGWGYELAAYGVRKLIREGRLFDRGSPR